VDIEGDPGVKLESLVEIIAKWGTAEVAFTVLADSVCVTLAEDDVDEENDVVWKIDDVAVTLATVEDVSTLENVSGYNGGAAVTCVLEVWFDDEVVAMWVDPRVELVFVWGMMGKADIVEVALTVLNNNGIDDVSPLLADSVTL